MPNGWQGVIASLGIVMFAFGGVEIIGVTAAEAKDPKKVIPQAINTIPLRIILFYVCTGGTDGDLPVEQLWRTGESVCAYFRRSGDPGGGDHP